MTGNLFKKILVNVAILLIMSACAKQMTTEDYLRLGEKYLLENNYEEAIVAYDKVIFIESKNVQAYLGKAQAQYGQGHVENAVETILKGIDISRSLTDNHVAEDNMSAMGELTISWLKELIGNSSLEADKVITYSRKIIELDSKNEEAYLKLYEIYSDLKQDQNVEDILYQGAINTDNKELKEKLAKLEDEKEFLDIYATELETLYQLMSAGSYQSAYDLWRDVFWGNPLVRDNRGIAYPSQDGLAIQLYVYIFYYGNLVDGIRTGNGKTISNGHGQSGYYRMFDGVWENGFPNGNGKETRKGPLTTGGYRETVTSGTYKDGLEHGEMSRIETDSDGRVMITKYKSIDGVYVKTGDTSESEGKISYQYAQSEVRYANGGVITMSGYVEEGSIWGMAHLDLWK